MRHRLKTTKYMVEIKLPSVTINFAWASRILCRLRIEYNEYYFQCVSRALHNIAFSINGVLSRYSVIIFIILIIIIIIVIIIIINMTIMYFATTALF